MIVFSLKLEFCCNVRRTHLTRKKKEEPILFYGVNLHSVWPSHAEGNLLDFWDLYLSHVLSTLLHKMLSEDKRMDSAVQLPEFMGPGIYLTTLSLSFFLYKMGEIKNYN